MGISGFSMMTFLQDLKNNGRLLFEEDNINKLWTLFSNGKEIIMNMLDAGVDAISFYDDWGVSGLFLSVPMWASTLRKGTVNNLP